MDRTSDQPAEGAEIASMEDLERRLVSWARARPDIRMMLVVGSRARLDVPADEWSDLDVAFSTTSPKPYLATMDWLNEVGEVWVAYADPQGVTRHVLFAGGLDAGIAPIPHRLLQALIYALRLRARLPSLFRFLPRPAREAVDRQIDEVAGYCRRGVRVVVDKDGLGTRALAGLPQRAGPTLPTANQFRATVDEFWFLTVWNAKHLRRGELWAAKNVACDGRMKTLLLRMIEWRTLSEEGEAYDTWENGRHLEDWADSHVLHALSCTFGHYDLEDLWRASLAAADVFRKVATETAQRLDFPYPTFADARILDWVTRCEADRR